MELHALNRVRPRWQTQPCELIRRCLARKGEVMDRHYRAGTLFPVIMQISGCQTRLPVVRVHHFGQVSFQRAATNVRRDASQRGEAHGVVRPIMSVRPEIRIASPRVEVRGVEHK